MHKVRGAKVKAISFAKCGKREKRSREFRTRGKNDFEGSKILLDTNLKIILLET